MRVLVLDAEQKSALASIRSLGRHGVEALAGTTRRIARGSVSRYANGRVHLASPDDSATFVDSVLTAVHEHEVDVVLPIGDASNRVLSQHKAVVAPHTAIPVADWASMQVACCKARTLEFARRVGIPAPRTFADKRHVDAYPVVVKRRLGAGGVQYVNTAQELAAVDASDAVIQEYIPGSGYGFFALFEHGVPRATFMHRRIREYPVTGGASTAAESYLDEELRAIGSRLLEALDWHGVAMVEFRKDHRDGSYRLIEVNPKFWGSLDLAIASGVDFPWLAVQMASRGLEDEAPRPFTVGLRFQWVFDDMLHVAARPRSARAFVRDMRRARTDVSLRDPAPAAYDLARAIAGIGMRAAQGKLSRPHGYVTSAKC